MDQRAEPPTVSAAGPSLAGLRVAAALGALVAGGFLVYGFSVAWWVGGIAVVMVPVLPMLFVLALEAIRKSD